MMKLVVQSTNKVLHLEVADSFWSRSKGLLGRTQLAADHGLWILQCRSVHTFFMKFAIDLVFVDRQMVVRKTYTHVKPGRLAGAWGAESVIELAAGFLETNPIHVGEHLHVDHSLS